MKTQIAIIAGGLAIAAGVAYAELKPTNTVAEQTSQSAAPTPVQSDPAPQTSQIPPQQKSGSAPTSKLTNPNSGTHIQPPRGGGEGGEHEGRGGHDGGFFGGDDD
jgi:hypothetical protein